MSWRRHKEARTMVLHPSVALLAEAMQQKLERDHHKGPWREEGRYRLMRLLLAECMELRDARPGQARAEAADVANFAMMLAEVIDSEA